MNCEFKDKVVVITGFGDASSREMARHFLAADADVVACCATENAQVAAWELSPTVHVVNYEPGRDESIVEAVAQIIERHEKIDVLVNNAVDSVGRTLAELDKRSLAIALDLTIGEQFGFVREVIPHMKRGGTGRVVNINTMSYLGLPGHLDMAVCRSALFGMNRSLALEVAADGIMVNMVVKGELEEAFDTEEARSKVVKTIPAQRLGQVQDMAHAVAFFAAESTKYVTGQTFFVCGGKSVHFSMSV